MRAFRPALLVIASRKCHDFTLKAYSKETLQGRKDILQ